jgi:hypothetical protein
LLDFPVFDCSDIKCTRYWTFLFEAMDKSIPEFVKETFQHRLSELCKDLPQVEDLITSPCERERAGAIVLYATQFELELETIKAKLEDCLSTESSEIVKAPIIYHLADLDVAIHFREKKEEVLEFAKSDFATQMERLQSGSLAEKLGAIKFAEQRNRSDPNAAAVLYECSLRDENSEIRSAALRAMANAFVRTSDKVVGALFAKFALNENEDDTVRVCAAYGFLSIFEPSGISRSGITIMKPTLAEMKSHFGRTRNLMHLGVNGIDASYIELCLAE